jgi:hypothetical protein
MRTHVFVQVLAVLCVVLVGICIAVVLVRTLRNRQKRHASLLSQAHEYLDQGTGDRRDLTGGTLRLEVTAADTAGASEIASLEERRAPRESSRARRGTVGGRGGHGGMLMEVTPGGAGGMISDQI